jgi:hypothetical protein
VDNAQQAQQNLAANLNAIAANLNLGNLNLGNLTQVAQSVAAGTGNLNLASLGIDANAFIDQALESLAATAAMLAPALEAQARSTDMAGGPLANKWSQDEWKSKVRSVEAVMSRVKEARDLRRKQQQQDDEALSKQGKGKGPVPPSPARTGGASSSSSSSAAGRGDLPSKNALQSSLLALDGKNQLDLRGLTKEDLNLLSPLLLSALKGEKIGQSGTLAPASFDINLPDTTIGQDTANINKLLGNVESLVGNFLSGAGSVLKESDGDQRIGGARTALSATQTSSTLPPFNQPPAPVLDWGTLQQQLSEGMEGVERGLDEFNQLFKESFGRAMAQSGSTGAAAVDASRASPSSLVAGPADAAVKDVGIFAKGAINPERARAIAKLEEELVSSKAEAAKLEGQLRKLADEHCRIISFVFQAPGDPDPSILLAGLADHGGNVAEQQPNL